MVSPYLQFKEHLNQESIRLKRDPASVYLVAASKYADAPTMRILFNEGQKDFGENRLQDAVPKMEALSDLDITWHFIGHIQTNKVNKIADFFSVVHSVDSLKVASLLNKFCGEKNKMMKAFIQVNLCREPSKSGYEKSALMNEFPQMLILKHISWQGLMMMTPLEATSCEKRLYFGQLRELKEELNKQFGAGMRFLSMGMSDDWKEALAEAATHLRVGRALFSQPR
ncbi:MAG: YggS family pyridoxal phosphate-dependent enzyme [Candidatus Aureabacteria bacterium]|nr:YggS family pyridoxal phosphate-dependent enzyme [Candidatus Auribacterota bacterium]